MAILKGNWKKREIGGISVKIRYGEYAIPLSSWKHAPMGKTEKTYNKTNKK